jgi:ABC-2 type transport system ATP-binding protein
MIEVSHLSKKFSDTVAVDDVTFTVRPGLVTGFLGPNGAGKSTTMRMILGLDRPTGGWAHVQGRPYTELPSPIRTVGAMLDAGQVHPRRSALSHLRSIGATIGEGPLRAREVLDLVGLRDQGRRRVGTFSLGMRQRLGIAAALIGDPGIIVLDEPMNGLDPDGIIWVRSLLRHLATEGRTVFVSSHLMGEMAQTADRVVVVGQGRLVADMPTEALLSGQAATVSVRGPEPERLVEVIQGAGGVAERDGADHLTVRSIDPAHIARLALQNHLEVHELVMQRRSLEDAFLELTHDTTEYRAHSTTEKAALS